MADNFKPQYGLCEAVLSCDGNCLALDNPDQMSHLISELTGDCYTRLMLSAGVGFSEYTVTAGSGKLILSPTPTTKFAKGDKVWFECCSKDNLKDLMDCIEEEADEEENPEDEMPCIEGYKWNAEKGCYEAEKEDLVIYNCGQKITIKCVQYETENLPPTQTPPDGTFNSITFQDGKVIGATKVDTPLSSGCCCSKCCSDGECADNVNNAGET